MIFLGHYRNAMNFRFLAFNLYLILTEEVLFVITDFTSAKKICRVENFELLLLFFIFWIIVFECS